jgi:hypothetical protein
MLLFVTLYVLAISWINVLLRQAKVNQVYDLLVLLLDLNRLFAVYLRPLYFHSFDEKILRFDISMYYSSAMN